MKVLNGNDVKRLFEDTPQLLFEVTERCNFDCSYCGYGKNYTQPSLRPLHSNRNMQWETARTLLDSFMAIWKNPKYNQKNILIAFYGGEPLLNFPLIEQIVNYVNKYKPQTIIIQYYITTNGFFLKKHIRFLMENGFKVAVSLDGDQIANSYRRFRNGKETFPTVKNNLDDIYKTFPEYFRSNLSFQSVLNNKSRIIDVLDFFKTTYGSTTEIIRMSTRNICKGSHLFDYFRDTDSDLESSFYEHPERYGELGLTSPIKRKILSSIKRVVPYNYYTYLDFFQDENCQAVSKKNKSITCFPFSCRLFLSATGYLYPCEMTDFEHPLGQIINHNIVIDYEEIANLYNALYSSAERLCCNCLNENDCGHCFFKEDELSPKGIKGCSDYIKKTEERVREQMNYIINHSNDLGLIINKE